MYMYIYVSVFVGADIVDAHPAAQHSRSALAGAVSIGSRGHTHCPSLGITTPTQPVPVISLGILFYFYYKITIRNQLKNIFIKALRRLQLRGASYGQRPVIEGENTFSTGFTHNRTANTRARTRHKTCMGISAYGMYMYTYIYICRCLCLCLYLYLY